MISIIIFYRILRCCVMLFNLLVSSWSFSQENQLFRARENEFCWRWQDKYVIVYQVSRTVSLCKGESTKTRQHNLQTSLHTDSVNSKVENFLQSSQSAQKHCVLCSCCRNNTVLHGFDKVSQSVILFNVCYTAFQFNLARGKKVGRLKINLQNLFSWVFVSESACFGFLSFSIWPWH